jgi:uncharacterized protein (DUF58 family)
MTPERNPPQSFNAGSGPLQRRIPPDLIAQVRRLEIRTKRVVDELFSGEYHSVFKGRGVEFREVREYVPGDDVRAIDWNVSARMGAPFVKQFEEERELTVVIVADLSGSQQFGSGTKMKVAAVAELGALLAFSASSNQDKVGLILFTDLVELYVPPKKGRQHSLRIVRELLFHLPRGRGTDLRQALEMLNRVQRKRAVVFLLSDFMAEDFDTPLAVAARRHDLIAVRLVDPRERELPRVGLVRLRDAETGRETVLDASDKAVAAAYIRQAQVRERELERRLRRGGCDLVSVDVTESLADPLQAFFQRREKRR